MTHPFDRRSVLRSVLMVTGSTYVTYIVGLVTSTLIARSLGPADFGRYSYLVWLSGVLIMLSTNGLTTSGMRFISESIGRGNEAAARDINGWLLRRHYISLVLVAAGFTLLMQWLEPAGWEDNIWTFAGIALLSSAAKADYLFCSSIAKGYGIFSVEASTTNLMSVASLVGVIALASTRQPLDAYLVLFVALSIGHSVLTRYFVRRREIAPTFNPVDADLAVRMRRHYHWTIALALVAAFSNKSIETFLLNRWTGPEAVGFFAIAATLTRGGIDLLSSGLNSVLMPMMAHAFGGGGLGQANVILGNAVRYFLFLGLLLAGAGALCAEPVVTVMYGAKYEPAILVLQVMLVVGGLTIVDSAFGAVLSITDNQNVRVGAATVYIVVTAIAAILLVPKYGLLGAVAAHAMSRTIGCVMVAAIVVRTLKVRLPFAAILRLFLSALLGAIAAGGVLLIDRGILAQTIAAVVFASVYLVATLPLGAWHESDLRTMSSIAARVPMLRGVVERLAGILRGR
jgi:O-antigen/teichoic acid export membrane protein